MDGSTTVTLREKLASQSLVVVDETRAECRAERETAQDPRQFSMANSRRTSDEEMLKVVKSARATQCDRAAKRSGCRCSRRCSSRCEGGLRWESVRCWEHVKTWAGEAEKHSAEVDASQERQGEVSQHSAESRCRSEALAGALG